MNDFMKSIRRQLSKDIAINIIRANQGGDEPKRPFATYSIIGVNKGVGRADISYQSKVNALEETRKDERVMSISFNCYGTSDIEAMEMAEKIRKWFVFHGESFLSDLDVVVKEATNIQDRTAYISDSWDDFKWGLDVLIRYMDIDAHEVDYFDKVEYEVEISTDFKEGQREDD